MNNCDIMRKVFALAKKGEGKVSPNPLVGAILVKNGKIIGEGYHQYCGGDHAEIDAIKNTIDNAGEDVAGATLFCNLEPCCHVNKRTPPCIETILSKKIAKVVVSNLDPNPEVLGKGLQILKFNGVEVESGVLREEGCILNEIYFKYITTGQPFIHIKIAQSIDGKLCTDSGQSKWISGDFSRKRVHQMRNIHDAILIGRKTLNQDNPKLTSRLANVSDEEQPYRIVVGNPKFMNSDVHLFNDEFRSKTIILSTVKKDRISYKMESVLDGIKIIELESMNITDSWKEILDKLGKYNISSVLVEGGPSTISNLMSSNQWDKMTTFISPKFIGSGPDYYTTDNTLLRESIPLKWSNVETFGRDACMVGLQILKIMFTGLVKDLGTIVDKQIINEGVEFLVKTSLSDEVNVDDSVSVNGVCQTIIKKYSDSLKFQSVHTTLNKTTLGSLNIGDKVNLELALRMSDRIGGHLVQGHINGIGRVSLIKKIGENYNITFVSPKEHFRYIINEGSIAIDGISLTVADLNKKENTFEVTIIPHTFLNTNVANWKVGSNVNIEVDMFAKYIENLLPERIYERV